jgi:hypothetical protein
MRTREELRTEAFEELRKLKPVMTPQEVSRLGPCDDNYAFAFPDGVWRKKHGYNLGSEPVDRRRISANRIYYGSNPDVMFVCDEGQLAVIEPMQSSPWDLGRLTGHQPWWGSMSKHGGEIIAAAWEFHEHRRALQRDARKKPEVIVDEPIVDEGIF